MTDLTAVARSAVAGHLRQTRRRAAIVIGLLIAAALALQLDIGTGPSALTTMDLLRGLFDPSSLSRSSAVIVWEIRLPQALMAALVGAALAVAGAELQTILANPLASPFTLGMSSAATFGAAVAIVLGIGIPGVPRIGIISTNAFVFAFGSALLIQLLGRLRGTDGQTHVLFGIALFFTFNALVAIMQFIATEQALQQLVFWTLGSVTRANMESVAILAVVLLLVFPLAMASSWQLTALRLGQERASSFGVNVRNLKLFALLRVSALTGAAVAFVGTIAFIGLVGPHIARLLVGEDHRFFLPASACAGAVVMSLASCASKLVIPGIVLPIGLVTSLIGVPFFLALILIRKDRG
ncbi:transport system permease protein [Rhodopseudomonas palustris HaA2]|uniref:Transport system permease protein n=1 Tax=Rhodopseudomonas palustris (strain HaA2) TaxID=316058 RepID=Q2IWL1_RHOP2|nr:iron ABC transporter permease [Rhodopseudomonas palustris]ABD07399.1 transport system permease protein [Rhodopseudomonas palustris HaA2]